MEGDHEPLRSYVSVCVSSRVHTHLSLRVYPWASYLTSLNLCLFARVLSGLNERLCSESLVLCLVYLVLMVAVLNIKCIYCFK